MNNPNPLQLVFTRGVLALQESEEDYLFPLMLQAAVIRQFEIEPDQNFEGGTDKEFFTVQFRDTKFFVAVNEVNGLTVMLPDEY